MLKEGYKETEIGIIPNDWIVANIGTISKGNLSYGINAAAVPYIDTLPQYLRITDITEDGRYSKADKVSVSAENTGNYWLKENDIVLARTGASTGKSYLYNSQDGEMVYAGFLIKASVDAEIVDPRIVFANFHTDRYWKWVSSTSLRSGQPGINGKEYASYKIAFPSDPVEQKAIATALSDMDTLISNLEKLIAKKRAIKQGTMQELLSGEKRLSGFSDEWIEKRIGAMTEVFSGGTPDTNRKDFWGGDIPWMNSGELNLKKVYCVEGRITEAGLRSSSTHFIPKYSVLIGLAGQGKTRGTAAYNFFELCTNQSIAAIYPNDSQFNSLFLYYLMDSKYTELRELSSGDGGRGGLTKKLIENMVLRMPKSIKEQADIALVIDDMDQEISALQNKLEKYRQLKQGMMQKLLTGEIRLV